MNLIFLDLALLTYHLALHCFADFLCNKEAIRDHWFLPYFITAAFRISSLKKQNKILLWITRTCKTESLSLSRGEHGGFHLLG